MSAALPEGMVDLDEVVALVVKRGVPAFVTHTGGGCATIFAGASRTDEAGDERYAACAGAGTWQHREYDRHVGDLADFVVGPDGDAPEYVETALVGAVDAHDVARLIVAQATKEDPTLPLSTDEVDDCGLDGTGRGLRLRVADLAAEPVRSRSAEPVAPSRTYLVGLPVVVEVRADGSVVLVVDSSEAGDARDWCAAPGTTGEQIDADAAIVRAALDGGTVTARIDR